jgi:hypothetical protein
MNIEPDAFDGCFPAQVRIKTKIECPWVDEGALLPLIKRGWIQVSKNGVLLFPSRLSPKFIEELYRVFLRINSESKAILSETLQKRTLSRYQSKDGHVTASNEEKLIDEWLHEHLPYEHIYNFALELDGTKVTCDWYIPSLDLYVQYWEKSGWQAGVTGRLKRKFFEDHLLRFVSIYQDDLALRDSIIPARIKSIIPECKFRNLKH